MSPADLQVAAQHLDDYGSSDRFDKYRDQRKAIFALADRLRAEAARLEAEGK